MAPARLQSIRRHFRTIYKRKTTTTATTKPEATATSSDGGYVAGRRPGRRPTLSRARRPVPLTPGVVELLAHVTDPVDGAAIRYIYEKLPRMRPLLELHPPARFEKRDVFTTLVRSIIWQQLSGQAATVVWLRLLRMLDAQVPGSVRCLEPPLVLDPVAIAGMPGPQLFRESGLSNRKSDTILEAARAFVAEPDRFVKLNDGSATDEEIIHTLVQLRGVGVWTAHMVMMFGMRRSNVFPIGDLAIRKAFAEVFMGLSKAAVQKRVKANTLPTDEDMRRRLRRELGGDGEYLSYISHYMWRAANPGFVYPDDRVDHGVTDEWAARSRAQDARA
ncbi:hypothetical protein CDCA_CDCA02G0784 [Cyanidium caldarium]|uniref:HhH-GPD domain-containing protein n=1 Tax=Cyanidium caldarium TaxID=2771 RepID=A0AAV9IR76_CYACA|nr:hypothetical protein CDCA_CDCA02G0784 [Cyanidium caldarium]